VRPSWFSSMYFAFSSSVAVYHSGAFLIVTLFSLFPVSFLLIRTIVGVISIASRSRIAIMKSIAAGVSTRSSSGGTSANIPMLNLPRPIVWPIPIHISHDQPAHPRRWQPVR
jgi:hypothetical protein